MVEWLKKNKITYLIEKILFPVLLVLYPLNHLCYGVEWSDTGYNYANYVFADRIDPMWKFSTYLAHVVGKVFSKLPFGDRMIGLNFYTALMISALALAGYVFFVKKLKYPACLVFVGEVISVALCWCPTALLYNYLTYVLMFAAVVCLYAALTGEKKRWFVLAGIALGISVFVRFSNLAQMAFIVGVWAYGIICKKKFKAICGWTGWCVLGYAIGFGVLFGIVSLLHGPGEYIDGILGLFAMTDSATDYSAFSMVEMQIRNYVQNVIWFGYMLPFVGLGFVGFAVLPRHLLKLKKVGYVCCMALVFYWLRNQNMFNFDYTTIPSVFQWAVCLMTLTIGVGIYVIFSKKWEKEDKLLCGMSVLILLLTPLGSNNHLISAMNNLFFVLPVILWVLWRLLGRIPEKKILDIKGKQLFLYSYPVKALLGMIVAMLLAQSLLFGFTYLFRENAGRKNLNTKIENNDILKGMYTTEETGRLLSEINGYVSDNGLKGREVILYGNIPALSYYMEMPFALGTSWPDLASYTIGSLSRDLEMVKQRMAADEKAPVMMLEAEYGKALLDEMNGNTWGEASLVERDEKFALLVRFALEYEYEMKFAGEKVMIFECAAK